MDDEKTFTALEICAGAGGQALGLEQAGFEHIALVEWDKHCCKTLRLNRPEWNVIEADVREFDGTPYFGQVDLLAGGVPCPPFSVASKQLGAEDERNLVPELIRLTAEISPKVVMLENVRGLLNSSFDSYRAEMEEAFEELGYKPVWNLVQANDFGVPQLRPRAIMVAFHEALGTDFAWPNCQKDAPTVGEVLYDLMAENGWDGVDDWQAKANKIAPTIVGGSKKHGGPDLGPTRAKRAWAKLGVNGKKLAYEPPAKDFQGDPHLTVPMVALLQGFPGDWEFHGKKTPAYRQVGNAFPAPVAKAIGRQIIKGLLQSEKTAEFAMA